VPFGNDFSLQDAAAAVAPQAQAPIDVSDPSTLASMLGFMPVHGQMPDSPAAPQDTGTPGYNAPVTDPSQDFGLPAGAPPSPSGLPTNTSVASGAKVGVEGYNPAANAAIMRGPHTAVDKQVAADRAEVAGQFAPIQAEEKAAVDTGINAKLAEGHLESQKASIAAEGKLKIAAANQDFMAKERAANENAAAEAQSNFANYKAALMDYAASGINPSQLWDNAGTAGQFGIVATAFMHDFLAAKGVQTSGMESINKAIQNNINAQLDNMRRKMDVAQGFKQLWEMQRSQSATDAEARARMNGFYLSALSNQIEGTLGQYDSQLALVKAQSAKAAIQQEQVKNDLLVQKHIDDAANQRATNRVHMYAAELSASSAKYTADAHIKAAEITANAKNKVSPLDGVIVDTSTSGGNVVKRRLLPGIEDKEGKTRSEAANVFTTVGNIQKLIDLQDQITKAPPDIGIDALKRMQSEERRVAELVRNSVKMSIIYDNSGKQINEQEVKLYDELVSKKDWFLNGDNIRTLGTLKDMMLDKENNKLSAISTEILPGDPMYGATTGTHNMAVGEKTLSSIQSAPGAGRHENTESESLVKDATAPHTSDTYSSNKDTNAVYANFLIQSNEKLGNGSNQPNQSAWNFPEKPSKSFEAVNKLGEMARQGDEEAKQRLDDIASGKIKSNDKADQDFLRAYAVWEESVLNDKGKTPDFSPIPALGPRKLKSEQDSYGTSQ
jgi:hypothetical protein